MNHLANESSPYLLQHADNPVDWYPWGEEAFKMAKQLNRPIFLSIGYSTCHWCHVMEHESFEDDSVAKLLNDNFISIKVDREEMPEIDHLYMTICQAMTGSGGWPLTIVMTPDKEAFFAGTYFPKNGRYGRLGMVDLLPSLADAWENRQGDIRKSIGQVKNHLENTLPQSLGQALDSSIHKQAFSDFRNKFDSEMGGFGSAPKFPSPHNLIYLLRYFHFSKDSTALAMVEQTLQSIRKGGIFDQVGFGFHRYSTDRNWLLPHFEKMLYDQAMLALAYLEAFQVTGKSIYSNTAREIFTYVLRDMTSPEGGFYSAEDADSEGEEGLFYFWTRNEIIKQLGVEDGTRYCDLFNVNAGGNFTPEAGEGITTKNIPHIASSADLGNDKDFIESCRKKLFTIRKKRVHPFKDDKILTDWNGLMIAALARGANVLNDAHLGETAMNALKFINSNLVTRDGRLLKRYRNGVAGLDAHLDDYAFLIWGILELYDYNYRPELLKQAVSLASVMKKEFGDQASGGFFLGSSKSEKLPTKSKTSYDGAIPSGNSVAALVLLKLGRLTGNADWLDESDKTIRVFTNSIENYPSGHAHLLSAHLFQVDDPIEIVVAVNKTEKNFQSILEEIKSVYEPGKVIILKRPEWESELNELIPWSKTQVVLNGKTTYYICRNFACNQPVTDLKKALTLINE